MSYFQVFRMLKVHDFVLPFGAFLQYTPHESVMYIVQELQNIFR